MIPLGGLDPLHGLVADDEPLAELELPFDLVDVKLISAKERVRHALRFAGELHARE